MCLLFAATYPQRTLALVVIGGYARRLRAEDYPFGSSPEDYEALSRTFESTGASRWGSGCAPRASQTTSVSERGGPAICV